MRHLTIFMLTISLIALPAPQAWGSASSGVDAGQLAGTALTTTGGVLIAVGASKEDWAMVGVGVAMTVGGMATSMISNDNDDPATDLEGFGDMDTNGGNPGGYNGDPYAGGDGGGGQNGPDLAAAFDALAQAGINPDAVFEDAQNGMSEADLAAGLAAGNYNSANGGGGGGGDLEKQGLNGEDVAKAEKAMEQLANGTFDPAGFSSGGGSGGFGGSSYSRNRYGRNNEARPGMARSRMIFPESLTAENKDDRSVFKKHLDCSRRLAGARNITEYTIRN
jgi:hypothetical protein